MKRLILLLALFAAAATEVIQVQIVHRHGARRPLGKHAFNTSHENSVAPLYPDGVVQLQNLGRYVREMYIQGDTFGNGKHINGISSDKPVERDVASYSSNLRRTLVSSAAFLEGLYPGDIVPTRVFEDTPNDWIIRGYAICPKLVERLDEFLQSDEFKEKQKENGNDDFVRGLGKAADMDGGLENVFNVYDEYKMRKNDGYGKEGFSTDETPKESTANFDRLEGLVNWFETTKFNFALHKIHVAGGLLSQVQKRINDKIDNKDQANPHFIVEYSAHYPTLLTLWASLRAQNSEKALEPPADKLPGFGAALIFELHREDNNEYFVHMQWHHGDGSGEAIDELSFEPVAIGRGQCTNENRDKGCNVREMERMLSMETLGEEPFCRQCQSKAAVCSRFQLDLTGGTTSETSGEVKSSSGKWSAGAIGGVLGLVVGLVIALLYMTCMAKRKRRAERTSFDDEMDPADHYEADVVA